jgi:hypothetical protein
MSVAVEIAGQAAHVRIEVLGYENPAAQNASDANWLTCRVVVNVRGFEGRVDAALTTQDFAAFTRSLRVAVDTVRGEALFETDEDALRLNVELRSTGTAAISGYLREPDRPGTSLNFTFESDQSHLRRTVEELDQVNGAFPVRT